jgi:hypothetical protein
VAVQRVPFSIEIKGFVEIEAHPMPARDPSRKKRHLEAGLEWAWRVAKNAESAVLNWLQSPPQPGRDRASFGEPLRDLSYTIDLQDGYNALRRKATGEKIC